MLARTMYVVYDHAEEAMVVKDLWYDHNSIKCS